MQFVNTTNTATIDNQSRWLIRKTASRHGAQAKQEDQVDKLKKSAVGGKKFRFRLPPKEKITPQRQTALDKTIVPTMSQSQILTLHKNKDEDVFDTENSMLDADDLLQDRFTLEMTREELRQQQAWLQGLLFSNQNLLLYAPSAGAWDPFNVMSLHINSREQMLMHHYCM